jgi:DNA polymerase-4
MTTADGTRTRERRIGHLDIDVFYASVELLRYSDLPGLPVFVVGGRQALGLIAETQDANHARLREDRERSLVTTATYEEKAWCIHTAMGLMRVALLAPDSLLLPADCDQYRQ